MEIVVVEVVVGVYVNRGSGGSSRGCGGSSRGL